jgi:tight adherence protein C
MGSGILLVIGVVLVGVALVTVTVAVMAGSGAPTGVARSLAIIERAIDPHEVSKQDLPASERLLRPFVGRTKSLAYRLSPSGTSDRIARRLNIAGNPPAWSVEKVMGAKGSAMLVLAVFGLVFGGLSFRGLMWAAGAGAFGFFLPDILLYNTGTKRQQQLQRGMADSLDMLTVCVEAGQSFDGALSQVARSAKGPIAGEFARVLSEIQIGKSRGEAFAAFAARTTVAEAKTFVSALTQADRLGLPIANVLREQSTQMRVVRRQRAEESAQKVPVKILFPLMLFILPALFVVIIGPGAIRMIDTFARI